MGAELTDATLVALQQEAKEGMTELQLAGIIAKTCYGLNGDQRVSFIGATSMDDPQIIFPRQEPSHRKLQKGDVVLTELSSIYAGYAGQIHRPLGVSSKPTRAYQEIFGVAKET
jgi:Xaa-Pro aminopeptidase